MRDPIKSGPPAGAAQQAAVQAAASASAIAGRRGVRRRPAERWVAVRPCCDQSLCMCRAPCCPALQLAELANAGSQAELVCGGQGCQLGCAGQAAAGRSPMLSFCLLPFPGACCVWLRRLDSLDTLFTKLMSRQQLHSLRAGLLSPAVRSRAPGCLPRLANDSRAARCHGQGCTACM